MIDLAGAIIIVWHVLWASAAVVQTGAAERARVIVAEGVLAALTFVIASTLLKTVALHNWNQIGMFASVLAFRTVMKRVFAWERSELLRGKSEREE